MIYYMKGKNWYVFVLRYVSFLAIAAQIRDHCRARGKLRDHVSHAVTQ